MERREEACKGESGVAVIADGIGDVSTPDAIEGGASCPPSVCHVALPISNDARLGGLRGQHVLHPQSSRDAA
jgi:hypothetical protein